MRVKNRTDVFLTILFTIYMFLLVWVILFKLGFSLDELVAERRLNLIPFYYGKKVGVGFHFREVMTNIMIFVPFGVYLCMFRHEPKFRFKLMAIFGTSFVLESLQYILAVGSCDITDLITNTFGGVFGIMMYYAATKLFWRRELINRIVIILATVVTIVVTSGMFVLLAANR